MHSDRYFCTFGSFLSETFFFVRSRLYHLMIKNATTSTHTPPQRIKQLSGFFVRFVGFLSELIFSKKPNSSHMMYKKNAIHCCNFGGNMVETKFFVRKGFFRPQCVGLFFSAHPKIIVRKCFEVLLVGS